MIRAIAFDFDGVIVESVDVKMRAFAEMFAAAGPDVVSRMMAYDVEQGGVSRAEKFRYFYRHLLNQPLSDEALRVLCERFRALVFEGVTAAPWVAGALDAVRGCHADGLLLFIVSATPEDELHELVARRGIRAHFLDVLGAPRNKSELLRSIMTRYDLTPSEVLFVGDAVTDYASAGHAGVMFMARSRDDGTGWARLGVPAIPDLTALRDVLARFRSEASSTGGDVAVTTRGKP